MRLKTITYLLIFIFINTYGQVGIDHLLPDAKFENNKGYYGTIKTLLKSEREGEIIIKYTVIPSFSSEYIIHISKVDSDYEITYNRCSENYWYAKNRDSVTLISKSFPLENKKADAIREMFTEALKKCKSHVPKDDEVVILGFDGTTYHFSESVKDTGFKSGKTWTPSTPLMKELVSICESFKSADSANSDEIEKRIMQLTTQLKE